MNQQDKISNQPGLDRMDRMDNFKNCLLFCPFCPFSPLVPQRKWIDTYQRTRLSPGAVAVDVVNTYITKFFQNM